MINHCPLTIFTGTKAMFIKLVPLALEFEKRGWSYRIIDTGQHADLVNHIIEQFGLRKPDLSLAPGQPGVSTIWSGVRWTIHLLSYLLKNRNRLKKDLFLDNEGICFVHGDTMSTLLSTLIAKRAGQRVAHLEAGLRSHNYFHPFPEELVRILVMRMADYLFAPSPRAFQNLEKMGLANRAFLVPGNTNLDTLNLTLSREPDFSFPLPERYSLATVHRMETLYSKKRLKKVVDFLLEAHRKTPLVYIQHPPTLKRLKAYGFDQILEKVGVISLPLLDHNRFLHLAKNALFILTDGGSVQEEASYLGVPCLLLRKTTEREEGLGENVVLSEMNEETVRSFLESPEDYRRGSRSQQLQSPTKIIADITAELQRQI